MESNNDHLEILYQIRKNENFQIPREKPKNPWEKPKNPGFSLQKPKNPGGFLGFWVFEGKTRVFANPGNANGHDIMTT